MEYKNHKTGFGMLRVDMDNGKRYFFDEYTDYEVKDDYFVIYYGDAWGGAFRTEHMLGFFVEPVEDSKDCYKYKA